MLYRIEQMLVCVSHHQALFAPTVIGFRLDSIRLEVESAVSVIRAVGISRAPHPRTRARTEGGQGRAKLAPQIRGSKNSKNRTYL